MQILFTNPAPILSATQIDALRRTLDGKLVALCFGAGVDSTAVLVALWAAGIRPDVITFADTGGEKPETLVHIDRINAVLDAWGWPRVTVCRKATLPTTSYSDLFGNCFANETLPSIAFGMKSCSIKWKQNAQDNVLKGVSRGPNQCAPHPVWQQYQETGQRIVKLIGYDCGRADMRRSKNLPEADANFDYFYPLQAIGWSRPDCVTAITDALGADLVPIKSACFFCPASKVWELYWLAAHHPELLERSLELERRALTGRHSRFDAVEFGASWEEMVANAERFPSSNTTVGLGRSFAWNQWARVNGVVGEDFSVLRGQDDRERFMAMSDALRGEGEDNARDARTAGKHVAAAAPQPINFFLDALAPPAPMALPL